MNNIDLSNQINAVIDNLANKLQVPAHELWNILIAQAKVVVITEIFAFLVCLVPIIATIILINFKYKEWKKDNEEWRKTFFLTIIWGSIVIFFSLMIITYVVKMTLTCFYNPAYFALHQITSLLH